MKKFLSFILILFVLYIVSIFAFPKVSGEIANKLGIQDFNKKIVLIKTNVEDFVLNYDVDSTLNDASERITQLKTIVEDSIKGTQDVIDDIRSGVTSIEESYQAIMNSINETTTMIETLSSLLDNGDLEEDEINETLKEIQELEKQLEELKELEKQINQ